MDRARADECDAALAAAEAAVAERDAVAERLAEAEAALGSASSGGGAPGQPGPGADESASAGGADLAQRLAQALEAVRLLERERVDATAVLEHAAATRGALEEERAEARGVAFPLARAEPRPAPPRRGVTRPAARGARAPTCAR